MSPWLDRERWSVLGGRFVLEFDPVPGRWFVIDPDDWRAGATATGHFSKWDALKAVRLMLDSEAGAHQNPVA